MYCKNCNAELPEGSRVCYKCKSTFGRPGETDEQVREFAYEESWELIKRAQLDMLKLERQRANAIATGAVDVAGSSASGTSGLAIASLVIGIIAGVTSFVPIVNNGSFFLALIALGLGIAGAVASSKGSRKGMGLAVTGIVLAVVSAAIVLVTQMYYTSALQDFADSLTGGKPVASSASGVDHSNMKVGESVTFEDGMVVTVNDVELGIPKYDGSTMSRVNVTYANTGNSNGSFNMLDWRAVDANGVTSSATISLDSESTLNSGGLEPGGTVTGNVYFDGDIAKVYYYSSILTQQESEICWVVGFTQVQEAQEQAFETDTARVTYRETMEPTTGNAMVNFALENKTGSTVLVSGENVIVNGAYSVETLGGSAVPISPGTTGSVSLVFGYSVQTPLQNIDELETVACNLVMRDNDALTTVVGEVPVSVTL